MNLHSSLKKHRRLTFGLIAVCLSLIFGLLPNAHGRTTFLPSTPLTSIQWLDQQVSVDLLPGESAVRKTAILASLAELTDLSLKPPFQISRFVGVQLSRTPTSPFNPTRPVTLSFSISPGTAAGIYAGLIRAFKGNSPLPGGLSVVINVLASTHVVGKVVDEGRTPVPDATVTVSGHTAKTDLGGMFSFPNVSVTNAHTIIAAATVTLPDGTVLDGQSDPTSPVVGGATNVGEILLPLAAEFIYVNNSNFETDENTVSAFKVGMGGVITEIPGSPFKTGGGSDSTPFPASITVAGNFVFAVNSISNNISAFSINTTTGFLTPVPGSPFSTNGVIRDQNRFGDGDVQASPDHKFLFALNTGSLNIAVYHIAADGALTPVAGSPFPIQDWPFGMKLSPNGKFVAVPIRISDPPGTSISMFSVGADGKLTQVPGSPFAVAPNRSINDIEINCQGNLLFAGGEEFNDDGTVVSAVMDVFNLSSNGMLTRAPNAPFVDHSGIVYADILLSRDELSLFALDPYTNSISVFNLGSDGTLSVLRGAEPLEGLALPSEMATNQRGTLLFVANIFPPSMAVYQIATPGVLALVPGAPFNTGQQNGLPGSVLPGSLAIYPAKACR